MRDMLTTQVNGMPPDLLYNLQSDGKQAESKLLARKNMFSSLFVI